MMEDDIIMVEYIKENVIAQWNEQSEKVELIIKPEKVPGVWILIGKEKKRYKSPWVCLQVAQTKNSGREIVKDISYLNLKDKNNQPVQISNEKNYVNQFGEFMFSYDEQLNRRKILYKKIDEKYEFLTFICVAYGEGLEDDKLRKNIEKYVAYKTLCLYWVNGRPYKKGKGEEEIKAIKDKCKLESNILLEKIKESNYSEKANTLKEFLNKLNEGKIDILNY